ncbi:MAG: 2-phospho-L-lactate guanylyltransferase, partial [Chloroflexota bacterium]
RAKSRLADVLSQAQREQLAEMMLRRMLSVLKNAPSITGTLVISRDTRALSIARDLGAKTVQERAPSDLNPALTRATEVVRAWGGDAVLILPADLPFITEIDIQKMADLCHFGPKVIIASDKDAEGTNALLMRPAGLMPVMFGEQSYERHVVAAKLAGADVETYASETIELDIDVPADLAIYNARLQETHIDLLTPFLPDMTA